MAQIKTNLAYGVTGTIPTANIADDAITSAKLADDSVVAAAIADNAVVTAAINADAITAAKVADDVINSEHLVDGGVDDAHLATGIASSKLTGALPAISGASLTTLNASNVSSGTLNTARYVDVKGKINQVVSANFTGSQTSTSINGATWYDITSPTITITPSATNSKIYVKFLMNCNMEGHATDRSCQLEIRRSISGGASTNTLVGDTLTSKNAMYTANYASPVVNGANSGSSQVNRYLPLEIAWVDSTHSTTSAITYGLRAATYSATAGSYWFHTPNTANFPVMAWEILA